jgi:signal transduction histidine kinase/uncharacterized protein YigA (DUF484 family)
MSNIEMMTAQLKETCKITGARWAIWLVHAHGHWDFISKHGLSKARLAALADFISQPATATWLAGTITSGRTRFRQTGDHARPLACGRVFVFPELDHHSLLMVGVDQFDKASEGFFKVLSAFSPAADLSSSTAAAAQEDQKAKRTKRSRSVTHSRNGERIGAKSTTEEALFSANTSPEDLPRLVLDYLTQSIRCDSAIMSIRSGDAFRVEAIWNGSSSLLGVDLALAENEILAELVNSRQGIILDADTPLRNDKAISDLFPDTDKKVNSWMGIPIVIGQRVIGHLAFVSSRSGAFSAGDLKRAAAHVTRLAYPIENAIVFTEAARYLQQFALLNELASTASVGLDTNEVARRIMQRLRKTFRTDIAGVLLLSADMSLREYGAETEETAINTLAKTKLVKGVVKTGLPARVGEVDKDKDWGIRLSRPVEIHSMLAVPLKYRGAVLGVLAMASTESNSFSLEDEQLLVVIASQLAGMFENVRLHQETRERVRNLTLIHQVVQNVLGLNDIEQIAHAVADLMVKRFSYASASVILMDENGQRRLAVRKGETKAAISPKRSRPVKKPIPTSMLVKKQGAPLAEEQTFELQSASSICVPLKEGDHILGVIEVERRRKDAFSENDLLALEALAGVLSSVVLGALRYQDLQDSVRQLHAARETAIDIAGDLELPTLLDRVATRARELVSARGVELGLLNEAENGVEIVVSKTPWFDSRGEQIPLMAGIAGQVAAFGEPIVVDDYNAWNGRLNPERNESFRAALGIPLKFRNKVTGVLILMDDRKDRVFHPADVQLLELLAPQLTIWIRNARLYRELQERIQAQRKTESHLVRSARLAAVGEMAAGVAHELNNPLTAVSGFVELMLDELPDGSPQRPDLELVLQEAHRARGVVRRLLDFSRHSENRRSSTDINTLSRDVLSLVSHQARTNQVEVVCELSEDLPIVSVDPNQIKQVLLNLLQNAIQSMPKGGHLILTTSPSNSAVRPELREGVVITVTDTGEGIPSENIDRIFEPFFTTRPPGTGTGLGLSVSFGIINDHGGFIDVESQVNQGTRITVYLPYDGAASHV